MQKKNFNSQEKKKFALCKHGNLLNEVLLSARIFFLVNDYSV